MKLGISVANFSWPTPVEQIGPTVARLARTADAGGMDSFWTMDHFFQIEATGEPPEAPLPEGYSTLTFIAGQTHHIRLGTLVTCPVYREPGVLVKIVTSLDVLSGGRAIFGVGAGWYEAEARGLGIPFPSLSERFERLEEVLQISRRMWDGDESPFEGAHYKMERPINSPNSLQRPHPPILIGGGGERKTLRLVARYGDMCNLVDIPGVVPIEALVHKLDVLRSHCGEVGRDYDEIEKTTMTFLELSDDRSNDRSRFLSHLEELARFGIANVILVRSGLWDDESVEFAASLVPDATAID